MFLHQEKGSNIWLLLRPSDNQCVEVKYSDPFLAPVRVGDKWVLVIDSETKEEGSKSKYTQSLLGARKAKPVSDPELAQLCAKSGAYFFQEKMQIINYMVLIVLISLLLFLSMSEVS